MVCFSVFCCFIMARIHALTDLRYSGGGVTLLSHSVYYYYEKYKPYENNNKHIDMFCSFSAFNLNTTWIN